MQQQPMGMMPPPMPAPGNFMPNYDQMSPDMMQYQNAAMGMMGWDPNMMMAGGMPAGFDQNAFMGMMGGQPQGFMGNMGMQYMPMMDQN